MIRALRRPTLWLIVAVTLAFVLLPLRGNDVALREGLLLAAVYVILATNLNLM